MGINIIDQLVELTPLFAEFRRLVSGAQQIAALPLDIVDDASSIETAMEADRDKTWLASHEVRTLRHDRERFGLLPRLRLDDRDLCDWLVVLLNMRHGLSPRSLVRVNITTFCRRFRANQTQEQQTPRRAPARNDSKMCKEPRTRWPARRLTVKRRELWSVPGYAGTIDEGKFYDPKTEIPRIPTVRPKRESGG
jgi:hypothetical protein